MPIVVLGLSHKTAPPEVRNRHAFPAERVVEALGALRDYTAVAEAAIVSTCNRLEIYAEVSDFETGVGQIKDFLTTYRAMGIEDFDKYLYTMLGSEAVEQLLRVASGVDSMLIGEAEILAQLKAAMTAAQAAHSIGPNLHRLFRLALKTGKCARTETRIGRDVVSLGSAAVELASRHCDIRAARALVVGAGKMGSIVARHLAARGTARVTIANRTPARGRRLAAAIGADVIGLADVGGRLQAVDLVISATGRGSYVLTADMTLERDRPLLIVDIAVPRDVDPMVAETPGVTLYELADLQDVIERTLEERRAQVPAVEAIVADSRREYMRWYEQRAVVPMINRLREKAEAIRATEIERLFSRLPELKPAERDSIVAASVSIINRLLHEPVTRLRETGTEALDAQAFSEQLERHLSKTLRPRL